MAKRMLVVYWTWSNGNTERVAEGLAQACGADVERIETTEPYPDDYQETVDLGKREVDEGYERPIEPLEASLSDYDVVAVGTPTWWYTMAPAVRSLFSTAGLAGKVVVPFMTCAGWTGTVIDDMEEAAKAAGARVACPKEVIFDRGGGSRMVTRQGELDAWERDVRALLA